LRILILGGDGYLGWPCALHLSAAGHEIAVLDNLARRDWDRELGYESLVPIAALPDRIDAWTSVSGLRMDVFVGDLCDGDFVHASLRSFGPDTVVHFGEQRSAPYSMIDREHAVFTQVNNVVGTLNVLFAIAEIDPRIHLIKLGTMGEYGTPNIDIEEGWLTVSHKGRTDRVLYPKRPGSMYHLSKVHDSHNIEFACRTWNLRATDLNQGVVYGHWTEESGCDPVLATRFDYDQVFGTVLNRFAVQAAIGYPLTVYGAGGQTRGVINLIDSVDCIRIAAENPPEAGEFRVFNQFTEQKSVDQIAQAISRVYPGRCRIESVEDPRVEAEHHYYHAAHTRLVDLGLVPNLMDDEFLSSLLSVAERYRHRVRPEVIPPTVRWRPNVAAPRRAVSTR
jgi:UDP-sulfoquinovose synthase